MTSALAWTQAALCFAVWGWTITLYGRYSLFLLPIVALGVGALLSRLWGPGRWGALLVAIVLAFFLINALALWQGRLNYSDLCVRE